MVFKFLLAENFLHTYFFENNNNTKTDIIEYKPQKAKIIGTFGLLSILYPHIFYCFGFNKVFTQKYYNIYNVTGSSLISYYSFQNENNALMIYSIIWGTFSLIGLWNLSNKSDQV